MDNIKHELYDSYVVENGQYAKKIQPIDKQMAVLEKVNRSLRNAIDAQEQNSRRNSNQIAFILHIQGVFNLPGRGFRHRITLISSVPMTLNDVIVHVRHFVIALVSVGGCSSFPDPDGFIDVTDSSVGFLVYNFYSLPVIDVPHVYDDVIPRHRY